MKFKLPEQNKHKLTSYINRHRGLFWLEAAGGIIYNTIIVTGPIILGKAIDVVSLLISEGVSANRVRTLVFWCILFILSTAFFQYARYIKRRYIRKMCFLIRGDMRAGLLENTLAKDMSAIEKESVGDMMSRTVGDVEQLVDTVQYTINEAWDTWLLMISYFVVLLFYNYKITLICSIPIPFALWIAESARHPLYQYSLKARQFASRVTSHLYTTINSVAILRLYGREDAEKQRLAGYANEQVKWNIKTTLLKQGMMPIYAFLASIGIIGAIALGGKQVANGVWSVGTFTAFLTMFTAMSRRTWVAANVFNRWHGALASWERIKEKIVLKTEKSNNSSTEQDIKLKDSDLVVENLSFKYTNGLQDVLKEVSFKVPIGSMVGVTGAIGSGKSALALALTGLYEYKGSIKYGKNELADLSKEQKTSLIAYAGQESFLFSASIAENIRFSNSEKQDQQRLEEALYLAALSDDLVLFEDGVDTLIGERGVRVSGGQRQRIALARALYTNCDVQILDDPFSGVDIGTERRIIERLQKAMQNKTAFLFSHRLNAFPFLDYIIVLDEGKIIEQGTHEELMEKAQIYSKIYKAQTWLEGEGETND